MLWPSGQGSSIPRFREPQTMQLVRRVPLPARKTPATQVDHLVEPLLRDKSPQVGYILQAGVLEALAGLDGVAGGGGLQLGGLCIGVDPFAKPFSLDSFFREAL